MLPRNRLAGVVSGGVAAFALGTLVTPGATTYAAWSDYQTVHATVGAGVWLGPNDPTLPPQCAGMVFDRIIIGTNKSNVLSGTEGNDLLFGGNGQDTINGLGGDDCIVGQNGTDWVLVGGAGNDVLVGGNGKDKLYGGTGNDKLYGDNAPDYLYGGDGTDLLVGGNAPDTEFQDGPNEPAPAASPLLRRTAVTSGVAVASAPAPAPAPAVVAGPTPVLAPAADLTSMPQAGPELPTAPSPLVQDSALVSTVEGTSAEVVP